MRRSRRRLAQDDLHWTRAAVILAVSGVALVMSLFFYLKVEGDVRLKEIEEERQGPQGIPRSVLPKTTETLVSPGGGPVAAPEVEGRFTLGPGQAPPLAVPVDRRLALGVVAALCLSNLGLMLLFGSSGGSRNRSFEPGLVGVSSP
jgi:hypothetical protein